MALTKAEMSEYLFDKLGLSKRDAKELVLVTSICVIRINARDVTRKRARIFPLQHGAW